MRKSLLNWLKIRLSGQFKTGESKALVMLIGFVVGVSLPVTIYAVGMGGINVSSGLGQVLEADIGLVAVSKADRAGLVARLASPVVYRSAGLEYSYGNKFIFNIESRANGEPYLKVTSTQPINDPFVVMLVELTWSSGRLLREYTFLLDPPGYVAELPAQSEVQPVSPEVQPVSPELVDAATPNLAVIPTEPITQSEEFDFVDSKEVEPTALTSESSEVESPLNTEESSTPESSAFSLEEEATPEENALPEEVAEQNEEWIAVERGDTLGGLAKQYKSADVSLERMLVALYRANAKEFDDRNMNRIRAGKILRMPSQQEIEKVGQSEAVKEIRAQVADWNIYRQKLAGAASMSRQPQAVEQVATGKLSSSVADKTPVSKESAKEVLKLSQGEAPKGQAGAGGKSMTAVDKQNAALEDAVAEAKASKEEQARAALLNKNIQDMERLAKLKSSAAALAQKPSVAENETKPLAVAKPKPKPTPVKEEPSLLDQVMAMFDKILSEPLYLAAGAGLVVLGGLGWFVTRRNKNRVSSDQTSDDFDDSESEGGVISAKSSPESGDFTGMFASQPSSEEAYLDADPISEADLFLNFGRDAQAEEILKDALQSTPSNHKIHLKLLQIYGSRKDMSSFATIVSQLQNSGDEEAVQQALAMGREFDPGNPLYGGNAEDIPVRTGSAKEAVSKAPEVDFDLDAPSENSDPSPEDDFLNDAVKTAAVPSFAQSEISSPNEEEKTLSLSSAEMDDKPIETVDFDSASTLVSDDVKQEKSSMPDLGDLIFEVTGSHPAVRAEVKERDVASPELDDITLDALEGQQPAASGDSDIDQMGKNDEEVMEFTLDFPGEEKPENTKATQSTETDFAAINLNLDTADESSAPASGAKSESWQEAATKLDLAKAYHEMGDVGGAREILQEVMQEGDDEQRKAAQSLLALLD